MRRGASSADTTRPYLLSAVVLRNAFLSLFHRESSKFVFFRFVGGLFRSHIMLLSAAAGDKPFASVASATRLVRNSAAHGSSPSGGISFRTTLFRVPSSSWTISPRAP